MTHIFNFSAGPAMLPAEVMKQAQEEFRDWKGLGASVMELSHRHPQFIELADQAEINLRTLLSVPDNYKILFCQGGGRGQFAAIPLNLLHDKFQAEYLVSGYWSNYAISEARKYAKIIETPMIQKSADGKSVLISKESWSMSKDSEYIHYCPNETVDGIELFEVPATDGIPLVADMTSTLLTRPIDVSEFGVIYAGGQKNMCPPGMAVVIVRDDLIGQSTQPIPGILDYRTLAESKSMYNTPPTYSLYIANLVFEWLKKQGGIAEIEQRNIAKAQLLYDFIDNSAFYKNTVDPSIRSRTNIPFRLSDERLTENFLKESGEAGLISLKGHKTVGGIRVSMYNAMPIEGAQALVRFMGDFSARYA